AYYLEAKERGDFDRKRAHQNRDWMHQLVREMLMQRLASQPAIRAMLPELEADVEAARITPYGAARRILEHF
ncbi:MAG: methylmalonyl Co-A mutase-associated GTPase MeaB, partial [Chromatocurvus sp.]